MTKLASYKQFILENSNDTKNKFKISFQTDPEFFEYHSTVSNIEDFVNNIASDCELIEISISKYSRGSSPADASFTILTSDSFNDIETKLADSGVWEAALYGQIDIDQI